MSVSAALCPLSCTLLVDFTGCPVIGGGVTFYDAETTTSRTTYQDAGLTKPHPSPVPVNAYGRIPKIFVGLGPYKAVLSAADGTLIEAIDDLPGGVDVPDTDTATAALYKTGDIKPSLSDDADDGWLPLNGTTIGPDGTGATARAADDVRSLYFMLWNKLPFLAVSGQRGATALADWNAGKLLSLPDCRGRTFVGVDGMGFGTPAGILASLSANNADKLGFQFGNETVAITAGQMPAHTHTVTVAADSGGHGHTGSAATAGDHTHTGKTNTDGDHLHQYQRAITQNEGAFLQSGTSTALSSLATGTTGDASHFHNFTTGSSGAHTHDVTIPTGGTHTHPASASSTGLGNAHTNMQPSFLGYWLVKL